MGEFNLRVRAVDNQGSERLCTLSINSSAEGSMTFPVGADGLLIQNCKNSPLLNWTEMKYYKKRDFRNLEVTEENVLELTEKFRDYEASHKVKLGIKLVPDIFLVFESGQIMIEEYGDRRISWQKELNSPLTILQILKWLKTNYSTLQTNY